MNYDNILYRASYCGDLMTDGKASVTEKQLALIAEMECKPKLTEKQEAELYRLKNKRDNPDLSVTCKKRLVKVYAKEEFDREEEVRSKYMEKGTIAEPDSITLYSRVKKKPFFKNELRLNNRFMTGLPDLFDGPTSNINDAEEIIDTKSSWSLITYLNAKIDGTNDTYYWQGQTYMGLVPSAKRFRLVYCLINTPADMIMDEKKKLAYQMRLVDADNDPDYIEACRKIEINNIFDMALFKSQYPYFEFHNEVWAWDIPNEKRVHEIIIDRDEAAISAIYKRVGECREWMKNYFG